MKDRDRARSEEETEPLGAGLENGDDEGRKGMRNACALEWYRLTRRKIHHVRPKTSSTLRSETIDLLILALLTRSNSALHRNTGRRMSIDLIL